MLLTSWLRSLLGSVSSRDSRSPASRIYSRRTVRNRQHSDAPVTVERLESRSLLATTWVATGPGQIQNGDVQVQSQFNQVIGNITAVATSPTDQSVMYVGTANGGIWKTNGATLTNPVWTPLTDNVPSIPNTASMSITAIAIDRSNANHIVAATGKLTNFSAGTSAVTGAGGHLLVSNNGGTTWTETFPSGLLTTDTINSLQVRGSTIVATSNVNNGAILVSTDSGASFSTAKVIKIEQFVAANVEVGDTFKLGFGAGNDVTFIATTTSATDVAIGLRDAWNAVTGNPTVATASVTGSNLILTGLTAGNNFAIVPSTTNGGANATQTLTATLLQSSSTPSGFGFDVVGDRTDATVLYASLGTSTRTARGIYRSADSGATWTQLTLLPAMQAQLDSTTNNIKLATTHVGANTAVFAAIVNSGTIVGFWRSVDAGVTWVAMDTPAVTPSGDGNIHLSMVGDPTNRNIVYVAGDLNPALPGSGAVLFRGDLSLGSGAQFVSITDANTLNQTSPHSGTRALVFDAGTTAARLIEVDDGGIYRRTSPRSATGNWRSVIGTIQSTEVHDVAYDSLSNIIQIAAVDVGNSKQEFTNSLNYQTISSSDAGDVAIDDSNALQSIRYTSDANLSNFTRRFYDPNGTLLQTDTPSLQIISGNSLIPQTVTPFVLNRIDTTQMLFAGTNGYYESFDRGNSIAQLNDQGTLVGQNALVYGGKHLGVNNSSLIYAASNDVLLFREGLLDSLDPVAGVGLPGGTPIRDIIVNPDDYYEVIVATANGVYRSTDRGANFTNITANLTTQTGNPAEFRTLEYITYSLSNAIVIGTNRGVYYALESSIATPSWQRFGSVLPNTQVYDLEFDAKDNVLVAGLLGRGVFMVTNATSEIVGTPPTISNPGAQSTPKNTPKDISLTVFDAETPNSLVVTATSNNQTLVPNANLVITGSGGSRNLKVTPAAGQVGGPLQITVTVNDGTLPPVSQVFNFTITPVNTKPTAISKQVIVNGDNGNLVQLTGNDNDPAVQVLTYFISTPPTHGTVSGFNPATGQFTYTPDTGYRGFDTLQFTVTDDNLAGPVANLESDPGTITLKVVSPTNQAPTITQIANQTIKEDGSTGDLPFTIGDPDTPLGELTITVLSSNPNVISNNNFILKGSAAGRSIRVFSDRNGGSAVISITVDDNSGKTTTMSFTVNVTQTIGVWAVAVPQADGSIRLRPTFVDQSGINLSLTDENGNFTTAVFQTAGTIAAASPTWGKGLGTLSSNTIRWANGPVWTKVPEVKGIYFHNGARTYVDQNGLDLNFTDEFGRFTEGRFTTDIQSIIAFGYGATGTLSGGSIFFNNSEGTWKKIPDLTGDYLNARIDQVGDQITINYGQATARFLDSKTIFSDTWGIRGEIQVDRIRWENNVVWQRLANVDGLWFDRNAGNYATIRQDFRGVLNLTNGSGVTTTGQFTSGVSIQTVAFGVATLSDRNRTLRFGSGQVRWDRIVNLETLDEVYTGDDFWPFR